MSEVRADTFTDAAGTGSPDFPNNLTVNGSLLSQGGARSASNVVYSAQSGNYTILDDDNVDVVGVTTGVTTRIITLPTAADNADRSITIVKVDSGTGAVEIDGEGAETISGTTVAYLEEKDDSMTLKCDGTGWKMVAVSRKTRVIDDQDTSGIADATTTDIGSDTLSLKAGTYRIVFAASASVTHSVAPTYALIGLIVADAANAQIGSDSSVGIPQAQSTRNRAAATSSFEHTFVSDTAIKLRATVTVVGGTISDRRVLSGYIAATRVSP
jgi:hypothetical protein